MALAVGRWQPPPDAPSLTGRQVDLWSYRLASSADLNRLRQILVADELSRAERLLSCDKRRQFICARAGLRQILSRYLAQPAETLLFQYGKQGKPTVAGSSPIQFNLSHSGDLALLAVTSAGELGVDLEQIDPQSDFMPIAAHYFTQSAKSRLHHAPGVRQRRCFYRLWTAQESCLKLSGAGFSGSAPADAAQTEPFVRSIFVARNYVAALATDFLPSRINRYRFIIDP